MYKFRPLWSATLDSFSRNYFYLTDNFVYNFLMQGVVFNGAKEVGNGKYL